MTWKDKLDAEVHRPPVVKVKEKVVEQLRCSECKKDSLELEYQKFKEKNENIYQEKVSKLENEKNKFQATKTAYIGGFGFLALYSIILTVLTGLNNKVFLHDLKMAFTGLIELLKDIWSILSNMATWVAKQADKVPQDIIATILHWIALIGIYVIGIAGMVILLALGVKKLIQFYKENHFDDMNTLIIILMSLIIEVFYGGLIRKFIPINLIVLLLIIQAIYITTRWAKNK